MLESHPKSCNIVKTESEKRSIPSASSALIIGGILGIIQAVLLISLAEPALNIMGVKSVRKLIINEIIAFISFVCYT